MDKSTLDAEIAAQTNLIRNKSLELARSKRRIEDLRQTLENLSKSLQEVQSSLLPLEKEIGAESGHLGELLLKRELHEYEGKD